MKLDLKNKFLFVFFIISAGSIIITAVHEYYFQRNFFIKKIERIALNDLSLAEKEILDLHKWIIRDIDLIKNLPDFKDYLNSPLFYLRKRVLESFITVANTHKIYDQIRFLDLNGFEILRINYKNNYSIIVPKNKLQYKGQRYYFQEAKKLHKNEIYISPLDLNIENNKIEIPFKPVIRYVTPVYDIFGNKKGYLVLNVLGCEILKILSNRQKQNFGDYFLINKYGYYLYHPDFKKTFSFMFHNKKQYKLNLTKFLGKDYGAIIEKKGILSSLKIIVYKKVKLSPYRFWYIAHSIRYNSFFPESQTYFKHIIILILVMTLFCFFPAIIFALKFVKPLKELTEKAELVKNGNLNVKVPVFSNDEFGKFCETFNSMIRKLKESDEFKKRLREEITLLEEKERRKIGEFIHEELAQDIAYLKFKLKEIQEKKCVDTTEDFKNLEELTTKIISRIRNTIFELYPAVLYKHGLIDAIEWYIPIYVEKTNIKVTLNKNIKSDLKISKAKEIYIFRAFKEIMNNVWKHAKAKEVIISIVINQDKVRLIIDDDGIGFEPEEVFKQSKINGIGLFSIKEWVQDMNGQFIIESQHGNGTRVIIEIYNKEDN